MKAGIQYILRGYWGYLNWTCLRLTIQGIIWMMIIMRCLMGSKCLKSKCRALKRNSTIKNRHKFHLIAPTKKQEINYQPLRISINNPISLNPSFEIMIIIKRTPFTSITALNRALRMKVLYIRYKIFNNWNNKA